jgi:hypothetical protein
MQHRVIKLTKDNAICIYKLKEKRKQIIVEDLAKQFNVSSKTIRDIWNGKTWAKVTGHVSADAVGNKAPGRPVGSKDKKPRITQKKKAKQTIDDVLFQGLGNFKDPFAQDWKKAKERM